MRGMVGGLGTVNGFLGMVPSQGMVEVGLIAQLENTQHVVCCVSQFLHDHHQNP